jgi:starch synthase
MVATECAPVAQAGGLGEVIFGLSRELELRGHRVEIILPKYDCMRYDQIFELSVAYEDLRVPWYGGFVHCTVWFGYVHGRRCFFIDPHSPDRFFNRGHLYGSPDDLMRFAFFSKAAMEYMLKANRRPDVIHCHDWQTALVPVLLYEIYAHIGMHDQRVCYTIHNFAHQGVTVTGERILQATGLARPEYFFHHDRLQDNFNPKALNLMKGGIVYANFVTTVSPQHTWEAMYSDQAMGLQHTLQVHQGKFGGVLNGVDYDVWNPEVDVLIPERYTPQTLDRKYVCKEGLRNRFWLRKDFKPIIAYLGRIDRQKGVHLIEHTIHYGLARGAQVVLMGECPDPAVNAHFWQLKRRLNDNPDCHLEIAFNTGLAHLIFAGADMIVLPSMFEPCGLAQMIALKYGTVPIVRAVGGLVDTVFDRDYAARPFEDRNGYVFHNHDTAALEAALNRAIGLWYDYPADFRRLMVNGMRQDHSWADPGHHYVNIYEYIAVRKPPVQAVDSGADITAQPEHVVDARPEHVVDAQPEHVVDVTTQSFDESPEYVDALLEYVDAPPGYVDAQPACADQPEYLGDRPAFVDASPEYQVLREEVDMRRPFVEAPHEQVSARPRNV